MMALAAQTSGIVYSDCSTCNNRDCSMDHKRHDTKRRREWYIHLDVIVGVPIVHTLHNPKNSKSQSGCGGCGGC